MRKKHLPIDDLRIHVTTNIPYYYKLVNSKTRSKLKSKLKNYHIDKYWYKLEYNGKQYLLMYYVIMPYNFENWVIEDCCNNNEDDYCYYVSDFIHTVEIYEINDLDLKLIGIIRKTYVRRSELLNLLKHIVDQYNNSNEIVIVDKYLDDYYEYREEPIPGKPYVSEFLAKYSRHFNAFYFKNPFTNEKYLIIQQVFLTISYADKRCDCGKELTVSCPGTFDCRDALLRTEIYKIQNNKQKLISIFISTDIDHFTSHHEYFNPKYEPKIILLPVADYIVRLSLDEYFDYADTTDLKLFIKNGKLASTYILKPFAILSFEDYNIFTSPLNYYSYYLQYRAHNNKGWYNDNKEDNNKIIYKVLV